ncbi:NAD(P)-dependent oxidoreductase [Pseudomonas sp. MBLB4136]|uniref:NAD(P)-dependent oxidoreductase n=1 Tax=Pseudomonas sp. MBLB4136 TaxID=3451558 RepID=UPI003F74EC63
MAILVVGASGATGRLLVEQLLSRGQQVRAIVRAPEPFRRLFENNENLSVIPGSILELSDGELARHVDGCEAVASCLGHSLSLKGIYGEPRRLVTDAVNRLCTAIGESQPARPVKFVLMNTTGNRNRDLSEPISWAQKVVVGLIRLLVPPHLDNERAADFLRTRIGHGDGLIEWAVVRPDTLIDESVVTEYAVHPSPTRSAIFDAGKTSRINVAHFMADLITDNGGWLKWKGRMPVVYNVDGPL